MPVSFESGDPAVEDRNTRTLSVRDSLAERKSVRATDLRKQSLFAIADADKSGLIDEAEFGELYDIVKERAEIDVAQRMGAEKKAVAAKRKVKLFACFGVVMAVFLGLSVAANFAATYVLLDMTKDTGIENASLTVKGGEELVKTAVAKQHVPLIVAPVLPDEILEEVIDLTVRHSAATDEEIVESMGTDRMIIENGLAAFSRSKFSITTGELSTEDASVAILNASMDVIDTAILNTTSTAVSNATSSANAKSGKKAHDALSAPYVTNHYTITGYAHNSPTHIVFYASRGDEIVIKDGHTYVIKAGTGNIHTVCAANATCSSFKSGGVDIEAMISKAERALAKIVPVGSSSTERLRVGGRRRLAQAVGKLSRCGLEEASGNYDTAKMWYGAFSSASKMRSACDDNDGGDSDGWNCRKKQAAFVQAMGTVGMSFVPDRLGVGDVNDGGAMSVIMGTDEFQCTMCRSSLGAGDKSTCYKKKGGPCPDEKKYANTVCKEGSNELDDYIYECCTLKETVGHGLDWAPHPVSNPPICANCDEDGCDDMSPQWNKQAHPIWKKCVDKGICKTTASRMQDILDSASTATNPPVKLRDNWLQRFLMFCAPPHPSDFGEDGGEEHSDFEDWRSELMGKPGTGGYYDEWQDGGRSNWRYRSGQGFHGEGMGKANFISPCSWTSKGWKMKDRATSNSIYDNFEYRTEYFKTDHFENNEWYAEMCCLCHKTNMVWSDYISPHKGIGSVGGYACSIQDYERGICFPDWHSQLPNYQPGSLLSVTANTYCHWRYDRKADKNRDCVANMNGRHKESQALMASQFTSMTIDRLKDLRFGMTDGNKHQCEVNRDKLYPSAAEWLNIQYLLGLVMPSVMDATRGIDADGGSGSGTAPLKPATSSDWLKFGISPPKTSGKWKFGGTEGTEFKDSSDSASQALGSYSSPLLALCYWGNLPPITMDSEDCAEFLGSARDFCEHTQNNPPPSPPPPTKAYDCALDMKDALVDGRVYLDQRPIEDITFYHNEDADYRFCGNGLRGFGAYKGREGELCQCPTDATGGCAGYLVVVDYNTGPKPLLAVSYPTAIAAGASATCDLAGGFHDPIFGPELRNLNPSGQNKRPGAKYDTIIKRCFMRINPPPPPPSPPPAPISTPKCHPAASTVELVGGESVRLDEVRVGTFIRTPSGFEPIVGFLHADKDVIGSYHVFTTTKNATIAIASKHFLFVDGAEVDPDTVTLGQALSTPDGPQDIITIAREARVGAYHLITPSGAYYVDGIAASTYIAYCPRTAWTVFGNGYTTLRYKLGLPVVPEGKTPLPLFWLFHFFQALSVPVAVQSSVLWPLTAGTIMTTELVSAIGMAIAKVPAPTLIAAPLLALMMAAAAK